MFQFGGVASEPEGDMELWGWRWTMFLELSVIVAFLFGVGLVLAIVVETFKRRFNHAHLEAHPIFEDPNSLKPVRCPYINDPAEKYISLIIPAFNEEHRLPAALDETMNYLQQRSRKDQSFSYEVIVVDDGSKDGTKKVAFDFVRKYKVDNVRVILQRKNQGKGEAIRKGMLHSRGQLLLMLDADGATKVDDLEKLETQILAVAKMKGVEANGLSEGIGDIPIVAFGSRAHLEKKALATRKWYRNFLMKGFHLVVLLAAGPGVRDTQCGFKMFTRAAARKLFTNIRLKRLTEEATDEDSWPSDTRTMGLISRAAFEVDEYWRIVDVLHKRLWKFDKENWRGSYKALVLLEHLLTHGPERVSEEFQCDKEVIKEMSIFQHVDEKRFNWGLRVREKSERILKLLEEDRSFLKQERSKARELTSGIKGFGSFTQRSIEKRLGESRSQIYFRCNFNNDGDEGNKDLNYRNRDVGDDDEHQDRASLLSTYV